MAALSVEHLKVMAASRACLRILSLWSSASGPYGRAPKGDGGQSSLLAHPLPMVERLRTLSVEPPKGSSPLWSSLLTHPYQSSRVEQLKFQFTYWVGGVGRALPDLSLSVEPGRATKVPLLISRAPCRVGGRANKLPLPCRFNLLIRWRNQRATKVSIYLLGAKSGSIYLLGGVTKERINYLSLPVQFTY